MNEVQQEARNLILIGFMGTGKSTIGKFSARSLGFRYVDTDDVIVDLAGMSIPEIFQNQGEEAFRDIEIEAVQKVAKSNNQVIATGGGIVTREANRKILKRCGYVIWLKADPESIFERVSRNRNRPLLQTENPLATIRELLAEREELYRETADFEVNTSELTVDEIVHGVTESARIAFC